jgi:hypothetical protein
MKIDLRFAQFWLIGSGHSEQEFFVESTQKTDTFIFRQNQARTLTTCIAEFSSSHRTSQRPRTNAIGATSRASRQLLADQRCRRCDELMNVYIVVWLHWL